MRILWKSGTIWRRIPWKVLRTRALLFGLALVFVIFFPAGTPGGNSLEERVLGHARDVLYNYVTWELNAIVHKIQQVQSSLAPYMTEAERSAFVHAYLQAVGRLHTLNRQIEALYSDPSVRDPEAASVELRQARDAVQRELDQRQPLAEAIIETQVAAVLRDEGFGTLGEVFPPVSAKITGLPMLLVISPRDAIRRELAVNVVNLSVDALTDLEQRIERDLNVSSLVVPIGGLALYPSMVIQTWHAPFLFETVAHEWAHHYLYFFPLGLEYLNPGSETWIINETTASMFGKEIGRQTIERFYADYPDILRLLPAEPLPVPDEPPVRPTPAPRDPDERPAFDFSAELHKTRITVDAYLHFGQVELAERYMEGQRRVFAAHGHPLRRLNQAYFAFYGGYQGPAGGGSAGADPIGPAIGALRQHSPSVKAWLEIMRGITSRGQLLAVREALIGP